MGLLKSIDVDSFLSSVAGDKNNFTLSLTENFAIKLVHKDGYCNLFIGEARAGTSIPYLKHEQKKIILMLSGSAEVLIGDEKDSFEGQEANTETVVNNKVKTVFEAYPFGAHVSAKSSYLLSPGVSCTINPNVPHKIRPFSDINFLSVFIPPLPVDKKAL